MEENQVCNNVPFNLALLKCFETGLVGADNNKPTGAFLSKTIFVKLNTWICWVAQFKVNADNFQFTRENASIQYKNQSEIGQKLSKLSPSACSLCNKWIKRTLLRYEIWYWPCIKQKIILLILLFCLKSFSIL